MFSGRLPKHIDTYLPLPTINIKFQTLYMFSLQRAGFRTAAVEFSTLSSHYSYRAQRRTNTAIVEIIANLKF